MITSAVVMLLLPIHLRTTLHTLPHQCFLRTVPQHPEALGFHPRYQEITILDSTITTRTVATQVSLLAITHPLKVLLPLTHRPLALHPRHTAHPLAPLRAGPGPPSQYPPPPGAPGNYPPPPGPPGGYGARPSPTSGGYGYAPPSGPPQRPPNQQQLYGPQMQGPNHQMQQPFFQYSQCNGKKKALCIGINYTGQQGELRGCINDANSMKRFLMVQFGYKEEDMVILTDDARDPRQVPTQQNILRAMEWLARDARPNDSLFFHYSGHGGQTKDLDGDEEDGFDEVIYPVDFKQNGHIVDDLMHQIMVKPLPAGCRLTAIFDSCHSGSALDLPYVYSTEGKIKEPNLAAEAGQGLLTAVTSYARGDLGGMFNSVTGLIKTASGNGQKADKISKATRTSPADCISWSGCKDSQTSADTQEAGRATGAMSYAFIKALSENPQQSYQQLLNSLRAILKAKYSQKPQLSSSHPMDTNLLFIA
ncbi:caspase domain-containing protein [Suillus paluster]|uniref:caspase domain-containing protein n=1 Tax=Suillus paluster TaxID=48578 RepID=UPI001B878F16|nr:caspase domain-containing protein [Suillus paluster]KAG1729665.1 caspase domain-containing protein [Suillus paluster]